MEKDINQKVPVRITYFDNLKLYLVVMVIINHSALPYIPMGEWALYQPSLTSDVMPFATYFVGVNIAYIMSQFFFVSGYFFRLSYNNSQGENFIKKKLIRLGIPLIIFVFIHSLWLKHYDVGHLWYLQDLIILAFFYWVYKRYLKSRLSEFLFVADLDNLLIKTIKIFKKRPIISFIVVGLFLGCVTCVIRFIFPFGTFRLVARLIYVDCAHIPQYITMFLLGLLCNKYSLIQSISRLSGIAMFIGGVLMLVLYVSLFGANPSSVTYSFAESLFCVLFNLGLVVIFREYVNNENFIMKFFANLSYGAHIVHLHILIVLFHMMDKCSMSVSLKFGVIALIGIIVSFFITYVLKRNSLVSKII